MLIISSNLRLNGAASAQMNQHHEGVEWEPKPHEGRGCVYFVTTLKCS